MCREVDGPGVLLQLGSPKSFLVTPKFMELTCPCDLACESHNRLDIWPPPHSRRSSIWLSSYCLLISHSGPSRSRLPPLYSCDASGFFGRHLVSHVDPRNKDYLGLQIDIGVLVRSKHPVDSQVAVEDSRTRGSITTFIAPAL